MQTNDSDRKQMSDWQRRAESKSWGGPDLQRGLGKLLKLMAVFIIVIVRMVLQVYTDSETYLCSINMYSLLYINYDSKMSAFKKSGLLYRKPIGFAVLL